MIPSSTSSRLLRRVGWLIQCEDDMTQKNQTISEPFGEFQLKAPKPLPEQQLEQEQSSSRASRRDLKVLIKTLWAIIDKLDDVEGALNALSDKLEDMLNRQ